MDQADAHSDVRIRFFLIPRFFIISLHRHKGSWHLCALSSKISGTKRNLSHFIWKFHKIFISLPSKSHY